MWLPRFPPGLRFALSGVAGVCLAAATAHAAVPLKELSIDQLMDIEVYSASRHLESLQGSASAIFVLTNEDIRRAHVTTVPDALRLVPGVEVGRVDANKWAVSMRGFNSREANKLLVLVDGRSIYDPLFSGTLWESQDFMLEDIDRIEVIRGPGGTLWGANAFNGVINIVTRAAQDTLGGLVALAVGTEETYTATARYGWQPSEDHYVRAYVKGYERDTGYSTEAPPYDAAEMKRGGFRWDWAGPGRNQLRVSGDVFEATTGIREDPTLVQDIEHRGKNVVGRWNHTLSERNALQVQAYYDQVEFNSFGYTQSRNTYDLEVQQNWQPTASQQVVWGIGYRSLSDKTRSGLPGLVDILPLERDDELSTVFLQDTFSLLAEELKLTVGIKYESTDYADAEWLPNVRLAWTPTESSTWWTSVAEATRVPSRIESDLTFFGIIRIGDRFEAEQVRAYEVGHRQLLTSALWYDVALFYNDYTRLRSGEAGGQLGNLMYGNSKGIEVAVRWEVSEHWRLDLAYAYLVMNLGLETHSTSNRNQLPYIEGLAAPHQASIRAAVDLTEALELDATVRFVDRLRSLGFPSYSELDIGVTWRASPEVEFALSGQNLLDSHHPEQDIAFSASGMSTQVQRGVYGRVQWRF